MVMAAADRIIFTLNSLQERARAAGQQQSAKWPAAFPASSLTDKAIG
jgi:hypothetical protein